MNSKKSFLFGVATGAVLSVSILLAWAKITVTKSRNQREVFYTQILSHDLVSSITAKKTQILSQLPEPERRHGQEVLESLEQKSKSFDLQAESNLNMLFHNYQLNDIMTKYPDYPNQSKNAHDFIKGCEKF